MSVKNLLKGLVGLIMMVAVISLLAPGNVFAKSEAETQPKEIVVELRDDSFNPDTITLANKESTKLLLKNVGVKKHTFTVEKLGIDVEVLPGEEKSITVKPDMAGTYKLICRYHQNQGMVGEVIVE